ncbi:MAG: tRNA pseudouridine(55) synthase TruB [Bdellovibrionales bacterium]|jgi:tRNA pseudouridine55 synthase|nr:tRNA pseudouridine(55) synthase TruB [Bdellovibrionales bacterium]
MIHHTLDGVLLVDKDPGMTSHDVVAKARRILGTRSIGHAGTLDPLASGLLLLLVGEGTKVSDYLLTGDKGYEVAVRLGVSTDSMDITGKSIGDASAAMQIPEARDGADWKAFEERVKAAALAASGELQLKVPAHSAVKVNGKKLYESAHRGEVPEEIPVRSMSFYEIEWQGMTWVPCELSGRERPEFTVRLKCSKGSFIRAWANHVGEALGCGGTVAVLRRVFSAPYVVSQAKTLGEIEALWEQRTDRSGVCLNEAWVPLAESLPHFKRIEVAGQDATLMRNGQISKAVQAELLRTIPFEWVQQGIQPEPVRVVLREEQRLLALLVAQPGEFYKIRRVFQV